MMFVYRFFDQRAFLIYLFALVLALPFYVSASLFVAHVDKTIIQVGESIELTLEYQGKAKQEPDLSELVKDFKILSQQVGTSATIINGKRSAKTSWVLDIVPKSQASQIEIPPISLAGHSTSPILIEQRKDEIKRGSREIEISVVADVESLYVNAQLLLTIKVKTALALRSATIEEPEIKDAIIEPLLEDQEQQIIENGIRYNVFKKTYAVFPSRPGVLTIPPLTFNAVALGKKNSRRPWDGFFSHGHRVQAVSKPIEILIKDVPKEFPKGISFLPLKSFMVAESVVDAKNNFAINQAISRQFEMKAQGTLPSFLPKILVPTIDGAQVYVEEGHKEQENQEHGIESRIKVVHVYMPTKAGNIHIPKEVIYWWDTTKDQLRKTVIRPLDLTIKANADNNITKNVAQPKTVPPKAMAAKELPTLQGGPWKMLAMAMLLLWLLTIISLVLWGIRKKRANKTIDSTYRPEFRSLKNSIINFCHKQNAHEAYHHLLLLREWAERNDMSFVINEEISQLMTELEKTLYHPKHASSQIEIMKSLISNIKNLTEKKQSSSNLPSLYPV